jgi:diaminohydroxyphosphoribosylaminopyrimidine deaminase/5-amino-6-(5-phosphoribosylamino)uracil reductase
MSPSMSTQERFQARAIKIAQLAWGKTHPNPMVGALVVESGQIVAEGWHQGAGLDHAEVHALHNLGRRPLLGATLYVTLEPCCTHGRTGACTQAIVESGIRKVVVGATDPNPLHSGAGIELLRSAGVEVIEGVLAEACTDLNLIFNHWIVKKGPLIAAKIATSLDSKFTIPNSDSKWITGESARTDVMRWRRYFPAIAVSSNTLLSDNSRLTSRYNADVWCGRRFIFDRKLHTATQAGSLQIFTDSFADQTTVVCDESASTTSQALLEDFGATIWRLPLVDGHLDLSAFRQRCYSEEICGVYMEPGPTLFNALIQQRKVDYLFHYIAQKYLCDDHEEDRINLGFLKGTNNLEVCNELRHMQYTRFGDDLLVRGHL